MENDEEVKVGFYDSRSDGARFTLHQAKDILDNFEYLGGGQVVVDAFKSVYATIDILLAQQEDFKIRNEVLQKKLDIANEKIVALESKKRPSKK